MLLVELPKVFKLLITNRLDTWMMRLVRIFHMMTLYRKALFLVRIRIMIRTLYFFIIKRVLAFFQCVVVLFLLLFIWKVLQWRRFFFCWRQIVCEWAASLRANASSLLNFHFSIIFFNMTHIFQILERLSHLKRSGGIFRLSRYQHLRRRNSDIKINKYK